MAGTERDEKLHTLLRLYGEHEAQIVKGFLESHGITCLLSTQVPHSLYPFTVDGLGEVKVQVREENAARAMKLLKAPKLRKTFRKKGGPQCF